MKSYYFTVQVIGGNLVKYYSLMADEVSDALSIGLSKFYIDTGQKAHVVWVTNQKKIRIRG